MKNRLIAMLILSGFTAAALAAPFAKGDADAGKKSFAEHKCNTCHASMLGGDGSVMFTRPDRKVKTPDALAAQIRRCTSNLGLMLFEEDEENIGAYLNKYYYKFK